MPQADATIAKSSRSQNARSARLPTYRERRPYRRAVVTLVDAKTKQRKDFWLGEFGSPESKEAYNRVIAEWLSNGRRLPAMAARTTAEVAGSAAALTVNELALAFWKHAQSYYDSRMQGHLRAMIRLVRRFFGSTPAIEFGPKALMLVRDAMVNGDPDAEPPRRPWSRMYVNAQVLRLIGMFKWAASLELVPASLHVQLRTVPALRKGKTKAVDGDPVKPVPQELIDGVRPHLSRHVAALMDLQLLTGARSGELLKLRPCDIVTGSADGVWMIAIAEHKNSYRGHRRVLYVGPRGQDVLHPFLIGRSPTAYLFSPKEADAEFRAKRTANRKTKPVWGNAPGTNRVESRRKAPGGHYTVNSYRQAVQRACRRAFPTPAGLTLDETKRWRRRHDWSCHRLRHNAATQIRREFGLEAARVALGHSSALVTDAVYAERDAEKAMEVMRMIG